MIEERSSLDSNRGMNEDIQTLSVRRFSDWFFEDNEVSAHRLFPVISL